MATGTVPVQKSKEAIAVKTTITDDFLTDVQKAFDAISRRAFEIFEGNGRIFEHDIEDWSKAENELFHPVHLDVTETDDSVLAKVEVPGFNEKELEITVEPTRLTISGKRESNKEEKKGKSVYSETCSNEIFRSVTLPAEIETGKVAATLKDGVLELTMPKAAKSAAVQIRPQAAD
jgi:HSP20 family protein